jgi:hypothetical protein
MYNCDTKVINKETIELYPSSRLYIIRRTMLMKNYYEAEKSGLNYREYLSDENQLVVIMK